MKTIAQIDRAGRLVIPKAFRDELHLRAGDRLRVRTEGDALVLEPEPVYAKTRIAEDGWPVLESGGEPLPLSVFEEVLSNAREERDRRNRGMDE